MSLQPDMQREAAIAASTPDVQAAAVATGQEPFPKNGGGDGSTVCARCSTLNVAAAEVCASCHSFLPSNQRARTHGIYSRTPSADLRMTADELMAGIMSEQGGEAEVSTLQRSYVRKLGDLEILTRLLMSDIAKNGLLTPGGRVRDVYEKLISGLMTFDRFATRIGLQRKAKRVPSLNEVLAAAEERQR